MFYVEKDPKKTVKAGMNQKELIKVRTNSISVFDGLDYGILSALFDDEYIQKEIDCCSGKNAR